MDRREEFRNLVLTYIKRAGIEKLLDWLDTTDFYTAPASTRYHGSFEGGLVMHSLNVYSQLKRLSKWYESDATDESIAIVALFHDLCKVGCYKTEMRWRKDANDKWEQYATYKLDEDFAYGGHGGKSVFLVQSFIPLEPDEASAIFCHMGAWDLSAYNKPGEVYKRNKLAWLLHVADEAADYLEEE
jgi:hypothetical protein